MGTPTFAATELGRKPGVSPGIGVAVPLGSKHGVSPNSGTIREVQAAGLPAAALSSSDDRAPGSKPGVGSGSNLVGDDLRSIALARKPGAASSSGAVLGIPVELLGSKRGVAATQGRLASEPVAVALGYKRGIASGTNHIGEAIPQIA
jgi:hypothetical protein